MGGGFQPFPTGQSIVPPTRAPVPNPLPPPSATVPGRIPGPPTELSPEIVQESTARSTQVTRFTLRVQPNVAAADAWYPIEIDRPMMAVALLADGDTRPTPSASATGPVIWYNYLKKPLAFREAQWSERNGVCFLSSPGVWWLLLTGITPPGDNVDHLDMILVDAWHPGVSAKYLNQPGTNYCVENNIHLTSIAASAQIVAPNRGRYALTLQNVAPAGSAGLPVRISIGQPAGYLDALGRGISLAVGGSITFSGDTLSRGAVRAIIDAGAAGAGTNIESLDYAAFLDSATGY